MTVTPLLITAGALMLLFSGIICWLSLSFTNPKWRQAASAGTYAAAALMAFALCLRWHWYWETMETTLLKAFPVVTFYETAVFGVLIISLITAGLNGIDRKLKSVILIGFGSLILGLPLLNVKSDAVLFLPSLKSGWLTAHVALSFTAYAMYALAAVIGCAYLAGHRKEAHLQQIRTLINNATLIFTIGGLIFGAIWAETSWGRFWAWDPKETWAFITWAYYLAWLHLDYRRGLPPKGIAFGAAAGFLVVLFTYVGVNLWFAGLHSYAVMKQL